MTTSSFTKAYGPSIFEGGKMYQVKNDLGDEDLIVLCTYPGEGGDMFAGVVIHQGKSQYPVGRCVNNFNKSSFTNFHGKVILDS